MKRATVMKVGRRERTAGVAPPLAATLVLALAACGGGSPTSPNATPSNSGLPAGTALTFVSGDSGQPAAGAGVRVGTDTYTTDASGRITLRRAAERGSAVTVEAASFLKRETLIRNPREPTFTLWPVEGPDGLSFTFTSSLCYSFTRLRRFKPSTARVAIVPSQEFLADPSGMEAHLYVAERMSAAVAGQISFIVETNPPSGTVTVKSELAPSPCGTAGAGCAEFDFDGDYVVGGVVQVSSDRVTPNARAFVLLHELGHIFGLGHVQSSPNDLMSRVSQGARDFSTREQRAMRLMLQRLAGNRFPDNDTQADAALAAGTGGTEVIVCGTAR